MLHNSYSILLKNSILGVRVSGAVLLQMVNDSECTFEISVDARVRLAKHERKVSPRATLAS